jgi:hypothetical protein
MSACRSNPKRRCAAKRAARLRNDALRDVFAEVAQSVTPQARRLNADFLGVPPPRGGAPKGNRNAWKHGARSRQRRALFAELRAHIEEGRALLMKFSPASPAKAGARAS